MSVEATGSISIKASETKLPTMPKVNVNVQKSQAADKLSQDINTAPEVGKAITALPLLEAVSVQTQASNQTQGKDAQKLKEPSEATSPKKLQEQRYQEVMAEKAVENANNRVRATRTNAKFEYNEDIKRITITITDENQKVIKEIPPEETQKMLERLHTFTGMMMDQDV